MALQVTDAWAPHVPISFTGSPLLPRRQWIFVCVCYIRVYLYHVYANDSKTVRAFCVFSLLDVWSTSICMYACMCYVYVNCTRQWCYALVWGVDGVGWGRGMFTFMWSCKRQWCYALVWGGDGVGWGRGMFTLMWSCTRHGCYAVQVHVKLRCSNSCKVAHSSDATLWYGVGVGLGGVGACSRSCEVAHASDATLWYGVGVGLGGVGACSRSCDFAHAMGVTS